MGELVEFPSNGSTGSGYLAKPASGWGPGVIVIQEWWGLVPHITDVCDRFAAQGFVALAPDLFRGETTTEPDEAGKLMMALNLDQAAKDMGGAVDYLIELDACTSVGVGVIGFCMGGGLALMLATQKHREVEALAPFYGVIPWGELAQPDYTKLEAIVRGHFAADDSSFPPDQVRALELHLRELGKDVEFVIHDDCDHAFFNDTRPEVHSPEHSQEAWDATIKLFKEHIR
jgi:carboxymethylenebutenolidase